MKKNDVSAIKIALAYIGTVVGAGFATGQEILRFFAAFGAKGLLGLILTTVLFSLFGFIIISIGYKTGAKSHLDILRQSGGRRLSFVMDIIISFFLFGSLTAMMAGTGALFSQQFALPKVSGNLIMAGITAITVLTGIKGVINSISAVAPFLITSVVGICAYSIIKMPPSLNAGTVLTENGLLDNWLLSAILYVSYNTLISIAVLGPLGACAKDKKAVLNGAVIGALGLGVSATMIYLALCGSMSIAKDLEAPMAHIAGNISSAVQIAFTLVLIAEIYTTAVGSLYGFAARIVDADKSTGKSRAAVIFTTAAALMASFLGFSNFVKYLYPLVGYLGILLLASLLKKKTGRNKLK